VFVFVLENAPAFSHDEARCVDREWNERKHRGKRWEKKKEKKKNARWGQQQ
jgi:hypothetical protein